MQGDQLAIVSQVYVTKMTLIIVLISYNYVWWRGTETLLRRVVFSNIVYISLVVLNIIIFLRLETPPQEFSIAKRMEEQLSLFEQEHLQHIL